MRTGRLAFFAAALLAGLVGCGEAPASSDPAAKATEVKQESAAATTPGDNVISPNATVINDPKEAQPGGSYRVAPPDPNDPKFKADPNLGGGG